MMVLGRLHTTGNIKGNGIVTTFANGEYTIADTTTSPNITTVKPALLGGVMLFNDAAVSYVRLADGKGGPVAYFANITGENRTVTFPYPIFFANGIYINQAAATVNTVLLIV